MSTGTQDQPLLAAFPISDEEIVLICSEDAHTSMAKTDLYSLNSGLRVHDVKSADTQPRRLVLQVDRMMAQPLTVDSVTVSNFITAKGTLDKVISPSFIHGVPTAMELKVPHFEASFPYASTLQEVHVSIACCTGCNGGIHDRNLVVLNHHLGGGWSGIWVRTGKTIEAPYPRWQRVLCAGGVIAEEAGSMMVLDKGWMEIRKLNETPHHAPPPLSIETVDLLSERSTSLIAKSLDGAWVQVDDVTVHSAIFVGAKEQVQGTVSLPRTEILFSDASGGKSVAWLYQPSGHKVTSGQRLSRLRGFVHAEQPGVYVLLSDKEEDIFV